MREQFEYIKQNQELRRNLIDMKMELKSGNGLEELREFFQKEPEVLLDLLKSQDAKVRKNGALVLGCLGTESCREALWRAYREENQRFVRGAYLEALKGCDCSNYQKELKERRKELLGEELTVESRKHLQEELSALNALIYGCEEPVKHEFTGLTRVSDVVLITHRDYREVTANKIATGHVVFLRGGLKVLGADLEELLSIRTFQELLFCIDTEELKRDTIAEQLTNSNLKQLLKEFHQGDGPFFFRIECKSHMEPEQRIRFTKKLAADLEYRTGGILVNSTTDYELELRLIETKTGGFYPLLKLYTLPDHRFRYRKNSVAASIKPARAALFMELARPWLKEGARILDPFCGVGTMLLERNYLSHGDTLYGVDQYGPAIAGARENARIAGVPAHFVNRDFLDFTHEYAFDEIVTNFPVKGGSLTGHQLEFLYRKFFEKVERILKPEGLVLLYSHDRSFVKSQLREHKSMKLLKEWSMGGREGSWLYAIRFEP